MATFLFDAPALFTCEPARPRRLLCWLRDRLGARGVDAFGPTLDETGWRLAIVAEDGFVTISLDVCAGRVRVFVEKLGEADAEYEDTLAAFDDALAGSRSVARFEYDLSA